MRQLYRLRILSALLAGVLLAGFLSLGCQQQPKEPVFETAPVVEEMQPPWAVIYAFDAEGAALRDWLPVITDTVWAGRRITLGRIGRPVVLAASGMGMSNAAATTQYVIDQYHPRGIIFTGICGAIDPELHIGDIVVPSQWVTHDYGYWGKAGFRTDSIPVGRTDTAGFSPMLQMPVDTNLYRLLTEAADRIDFHFRKVARRLPEVHIGGVGVSGDAFIDSKEKRLQLARDFGAQIVDMESAAVLQTAHANGIPAVIIRSCSDLAGGSGSETAGDELAEFFEVAAHNSAMVVEDFVENSEEPTSP